MTSPSPSTFPIGREAGGSCPESALDEPVFPALGELAPPAVEGEPEGFVGPIGLAPIGIGPIGLPLARPPGAPAEEGATPGMGPNCGEPGPAEPTPMGLPMGFIGFPPAPAWVGAAGVVAAGTVGAGDVAAGVMAGVPSGV